MAAVNFECFRYLYGKYITGLSRESSGFGQIRSREKVTIAKACESHKEPDTY